MDPHPQRPCPQAPTQPARVLPRRPARALRSSGRSPATGRFTGPSPWALVSPASSGAPIQTRAKIKPGISMRSRACRTHPYRTRPALCNVATACISCYVARASRSALRASVGANECWCWRRSARFLLPGSASGLFRENPLAPTCRSTAVPPTAAVPRFNLLVKHRAEAAFTSHRRSQHSCKD
jgi:hypothetical protein